MFTHCDMLENVFAHKIPQGKNYEPTGVLGLL